jgi:hypothetical protein
MQDVTAELEGIQPLLGIRRIKFNLDLMRMWSQSAGTRTKCRQSRRRKDMDTVLVLARTQSTGWQTGCWIDDVVMLDILEMILIY